jgi:hypothetical protein
MLLKVSNYKPVSIHLRYQDDFKDVQGNFIFRHNAVHNPIFFMQNTQINTALPGFAPELRALGWFLTFETLDLIVTNTQVEQATAPSS